MIRLSVVTLLVGFFAAYSSGAELFISWDGHENDGVTQVELEVGQEAVVDVWVTLETGDTLAGVGFSNESVDGLTQSAHSAAIDGWQAGSDSMNLDLGVPGQQFSVSIDGSSIDGPGTYLIGTQTIKLESGTDGDELEIALDTTGLTLVSGTGSLYSLVASGSQLQDIAGFFHIGTGSPGYQDSANNTDTRDALTVLVSGSGVEPTPTPNPAPDGDGDGVSDDEDDFPNDPEETTDTDGDGVGNNADTDDDNDGILDDVDDTPLGEATPTPTPSPTATPTPSPTPSGPCGVGLIGTLPITLLVLLLMQSGSRRSVGK